MDSASTYFGKPLQWLQTGPEKTLHQVLADLLREMGYQRVSITHGTLEFGRDLVFMQVDPIGREIWRSIQAKIEAPTGSLSDSKGLRSLATQCQAALDTPYVDEAGQQHRIQEVWIVTPHVLSEQAKLSTAGLLGSDKRIFVIDGTSLLDLLKKYLPTLLESGSRPIQEYLSSLTSLCESPEEYIAARLQAHYRISEIYVPPNASVVYASYGHIKSLPPLSTSLRIGDIATHAKRVLPLYLSGLVSELEAHVVQDFLISVTECAAACSGWEAAKSTSATLMRLANVLAGTLGHSAASNGYSLSRASALTIPLLENIESGLVTFEHPQTEVLRKHRASRSDESLTETAKQALSLGRTQFFERLLSMYRSLLDPDDVNASLVRRVSDLLLRTNAAQPVSAHQLSTLDDLFVEISRQVQSFDELARERFRASWERFCEAEGCRNDPTTGLAATIQSLDEVSQVTALFLRFFDSLEANLQRTQFAAVELMQAAPRVLLLGELGLGKTTLMKRSAVLAATEAVQQSAARVPVFFRVANLPDVALTQQSLAAAGEIPIKSTLTTDGSFYWLFDGLDELEDSTLKLQLLEWVRDLGPDSRAAVTSRPSAVAAYVPGLLRARLEPLTDSQIREFIGKFRWPDPEKANRLCRIVLESSELLALAQTPLLLTLLIVLCQSREPEELPRRRETTYALILDLFLGGWDVVKRVTRPRAVSDLALARAMLQRVAYRLYHDKQRVFTQERFVDLCGNEYRRFGTRAHDWAGYFADLVSDCLVVPMGRSKYAFFHFSIHEYLTAVEMTNEVGTTLVTLAIEEYFRSEGWWEEALVFYAGIKRDVATLINDLNRHLASRNIKHAPTQLLKRLLRRWLDVADLTAVAELNPRGSVAEALAEIDAAGLHKRWRTLATLR